MATHAHKRKKPETALIETKRSFQFQERPIIEKAGEGGKKR